MSESLISFAMWMYRRSLSYDPQAEDERFKRSEKRRLKQKRRRARARERKIRAELEPDAKGGSEHV